MQARALTFAGATGAAADDDVRSGYKQNLSKN